MSNKIGRPWYKKPTIVISAIVVILAAIIGATWGPLWSSWLNPPPPDFSISVNPMHGSIQQGGVTTTAITVRGEHGYKKSVSLSASGQPSGVVISFVPPIGGATPAYTSNVTISVNANAPRGDYDIIIKGTGADGKEHTCTYTLTITPGSKVFPPPPPPVEPYIVYSDIGIAAGDVWVWSGADLGLEPPLLVDGSYVTADAPEGTTCFTVTSGSGHDNYVGWGVFLGIFKNHKLITPHTVDLLGYENLEFWTKTPIDLKVEIQQDNTEGTKSSPCLISDYGWNSSLPDVWQKVTIPKSAFRNVDLTKIFCPFMITGRGSKITFYVDAVMWIPRKANETK